MLLVVALLGGIRLALSRTGQAARSRRGSDGCATSTTSSRCAASCVPTPADVRRRALHLDPDPVLLPQLVADPDRPFERRPGHADFLRARVRLGDRPWFGLQVAPPTNLVEPYDPLLADRARSVCDRYDLVRGVPICAPGWTTAEVTRLHLLSDRAHGPGLTIRLQDEPDGSGVMHDLRGADQRDVASTPRAGAPPVSGHLPP